MRIFKPFTKSKFRIKRKQQGENYVVVKLSSYGIWDKSVRKGKLKIYKVGEEPK